MVKKERKEREALLRTMRYCDGARKPEGVLPVSHILAHHLEEWGIGPALFEPSPPPSHFLFSLLSFPQHPFPTQNPEL